MHSLPIGILCAVVSATRIWTVSSLDNVYPDSVPPPGAEPHARIYAAKGEYESFQICVRSSHRTIENLDIAPVDLSRSIGPPEVRRVDYLAVPSASTRAYGEETDRPDPLSAVAPFTVEKEQTSALWVTYYVPPDCPAGLHEGRVGVYLGDRQNGMSSVTWRFDFEIPATPNLTAASGLVQTASGRSTALLATRSTSGDRSMTPWPRGGSHTTPFCRFLSLQREWHSTSSTCAIA